MTVHSTLAVEIAGEAVDVDVELAGMITQCARLGVRTVGCCQDEGELVRDLSSGSDHRWEHWLGRAYVEFADLDECWHFHDLVALGQPAPLLLSHMTDASDRDAWDVRVTPVDGVAVGARARGRRFRSGLVKLRVPRRDVELITACLESVETPARRRRR